jgi:very-short-patch-repair endonuclease
MSLSVIEASRVFERRYGSPRGQLKLIEEAYGDWLGITPKPVPEDVQQRLDWYQRRIAKDFARELKARIEKGGITSPIEQIFLAEWVFQNVEARLGVVLTPQHEIAVGGQTYRVDFLITKPGTAMQVAVELDGHEFHERTPQQAAKDRARDRTLTLQGMTVLRFTGGETFKNVRQCVSEVVAQIEKKLG